MPRSRDRLPPPPAPRRSSSRRSRRAEAAAPARRRGCAGRSAAPRRAGHRSRSRSRDTASRTAPSACRSSVQLVLVETSSVPRSISLRIRAQGSSTSSTEQPISPAIASIRSMSAPVTSPRSSAKVNGAYGSQPTRSAQASMAWAWNGKIATTAQARPMDDHPSHGHASHWIAAYHSAKSHWRSVSVAQRLCAASASTRSLSRASVRPRKPRPQSGAAIRRWGSM